MSFTISAERDGQTARVQVQGRPDGVLSFQYLDEGSINWVNVDPESVRIESGNIHTFPVSPSAFLVKAMDESQLMVQADFSGILEPEPDPEPDPDPDPEPEPDPQPGGLFFEDRNIGADTEDTPPNARNPFSGHGEYPSVVFLHQQRLGFAASDNRPLTVWLSQAGNFGSMAASLPPADDDAIEATLAATQANRILWAYPDRGGLALGTEGGEWILGGTDESALTPNNLSFRQQSAHGSQPGLLPLNAGGRLLFAQRGGRVLREFSYNFSADRYEAADLGLLARHILSSNPVKSWAWQAEPHAVIWCALTDGTMAGLTYMREHDVIAWHRHSTPGGLIESVACIPDRCGLHQLWLVVVRGGYRSIERMDPFAVSGEPAVWDPSFDEAAAVFNKKKQLEATNPGRQWEIDEVRQGIADDGFASVREWWDAFGKDESVCPWFDAAACGIAGFRYAPPPESARPQHLDGPDRLPFTSRCIPCLPESGTANGSTFLRVRKINAVKCRVLHTSPFQARVGQDTPLPVPARGSDHAARADWALPLASGWREGERLELIFDGPDPATILGILTTVELAELAGGQG